MAMVFGRVQRHADVQEECTVVTVPETTGPRTCRVARRPGRATVHDPRIVGTGSGAPRTVVVTLSVGSGVLPAA
jgi:hypothetical protein